ncbi:MAG: reverse transcriptase family protein, partial [Deltaproteobacteria bacterium]|nr:reverse transcriptase family protein [Deltaproteobacteria bacterium]
MIRRVSGCKTPRVARAVFSAGTFASAASLREGYVLRGFDDPRNYRPITLLNGDYKIIMRALTKRMNTTVTQFTSKFQTGFVPGAFLPENIMLLKLAQAYAENENENAYFLFLDMEKAFDRCSWDFLTEAMRAIGYDDGFINFVKLAYNHDTPPHRQLHINGYLGPKFALGSGVAQGCPLSPLLFLLITEPLSRLFENDTRIQGLKIGPLKLVISQFADDTTLILREQDSDAARENIDTWCGATTMAENKAKREGMLIGPWNKQRHLAPTGVIDNDAWLEDGKTIRALGAPMGNNFDEEAWYLARYRTVKNRIANWPSIRRHSITG